MNQLESTDAFLAYCVEAYPSMSLISLRTLIAISRADFTEGDFDNLPAVQELADTVAVSQPAMTRILQNLGDGDGMRPGLRLIETFRDPAAHRVKRSALAPRGQYLIHGALFAGCADDEQRKEMQANPRREIDLVLARGNLSPLWAKQVDEASATTPALRSTPAPTTSAAPPVFSLYVQASSRGFGGGTGIGTVVIKDRRHAVPIERRVVNEENQPRAILDAIVVAIERAPKVTGASYRVVGAAGWMAERANGSLQETLSTFGGFEADGRPLLNAEHWRRVRAAAERLGGLECEGGPVRFEKDKSDDDKRFLKMVLGAAREAKGRRS